MAVPNNALTQLAIEGALVDLGVVERGPHGTLGNSFTRGGELHDPSR
jgi:hypothetical protein